MIWKQIRNVILVSRVEKSYSDPRAMSLMLAKSPPICRGKSVSKVPEHIESIEAALSSCSRLPIKRHL